MNIEVLKKNEVDINAALGLWGDMTSYNEALKEFKDSFLSKLNNLQEFIEQEDWSNYAILSHSIKSESKYLGFMKEADVFYDHELKGKENNGTYIKENYSVLKATALKIVSILNEYFGEKKNLLIADDSNIILNYLEKLTMDSFHVLKANNGHEAITQLANNQIYAILLDLNMPGMNGFEVLDYLKERDLCDKVPVVIITGDDTDETIQKAFTYPILDVLNKPFNENNMKSVLTTIENFYEERK